jgi:A/G-specific adenine glycosylase
VERHGGALPPDETSLRALPGIGPYTAAAIAAIAFGRRTFALDGNAARVVARLHAVREPIDLPATRARLRALGQALVPARRPGAFVEAVMELGATVCTPRAPACESCPVAVGCEARRLDAVSEIPAKSPPRPKRPVSAVCARVRSADRVLLVRRSRGLLTGTWTLPTVERSAVPAQRPGARADGGEALARRAAAEITGAAIGDLRARLAGEVRHVFTHRDLLAEVYDVEGPGPGSHAADGPQRAELDVRWASPAELNDLAVSSLLRKLLAAGTPLAGASPGRSGKATSAANGRRNAP